MARYWCEPFCLGHWFQCSVWANSVQTDFQACSTAVVVLGCMIWLHILGKFSNHLTWRKKWGVMRERAIFRMMHISIVLERGNCHSIRDQFTVMTLKQIWIWKWIDLHLLTSGQTWSSDAFIFTFIMYFPSCKYQSPTQPKVWIISTGNHFINIFAINYIVANSLTICSSIVAWITSYSVFSPIYDLNHCLMLLLVKALTINETLGYDL